MKLFRIIKSIDPAKKFGLIIFTALMLYILSDALLEQYYSKKILREDNFVIACIYDIEPTKSGRRFKIKYFVNGKKIEDGFKPGFEYTRKKGDKFFIRIYKNNPKYYLRTNFSVPYCFSEERFMDTIFNTPDRLDTLCH